MSGEAFAPDITIDRNSPVPLYFQISEPIARLIVSRQLPTGTRIEDELSMARRLRVSRPTARQALQRLVDRGLVVRRRGIGTQVAPARIHRPAELTGLFSEISVRGHRPSTLVLHYDEHPATEEQAHSLGVGAGSPVTQFRRLRLSDGEPLAILRNLVPTSLAPTRDELETSGLYEALRASGVVLLSARQSIGARNATSEEAELLRLEPGTSLLTMRRTTSDESGTIVEVGDHVYRADRYTFDSTVFAG